MSVFVHPQGINESAEVGDGTRIWAFAHVLPGARIGQDCNICDGVFIENDVIVGNRVTIKCGVQLWDGLRVEDDVFIGPNATFTNDRFPRSKVYQAIIPATSVARGASIGANCTIMPGIRIGQHAMIGAGSVVTNDVPPFAMVTGNPARITGYVDSTGRLAPQQASASRHEAVVQLASGAAIHSLRIAEDLRGTLAVAEAGDALPFTPRRFYVVYDVPSKEVRGERALRSCALFLVCVRGSVSVVVDDGHRREEVALDRPGIGLYVPPMIWTVQYRHSPDATLVVHASDAYDPDDYVRDYDAFLRLKGVPPTGQEAPGR